MPPAPEVAALAERKAAVRARIAARRIETCQRVSGLARPLAMVDTGIGLWRSAQAQASASGVSFKTILLQALASQAGAGGGLFARFAPLVGKFSGMFSGARGTDTSSADVGES
jgi:hypothetical protein